jgi:uncharacterized protein YqjF (DUF2071 family)
VPDTPFLTARWRHLVMANYEIEPSAIQPFVPAGTELDFCGGRCLVSIVGFQFLDTRLLGMPIPFHRNFEEVNLRLYVRRMVEGDVRRGVVFVKEIVPRRALAWVANAVYNEKYEAMPMRHDDRLLEPARTISYSWRHDGRWSRIHAEVAGPPFEPAETSDEAFITEHYWGYTAQRDGSTLEYRVEHPRWKVWNASRVALDCDAGALYGPAFHGCLAASPVSCFVAVGSDVRVGRGRAMPARA